MAWKLRGKRVEKNKRAKTQKHAGLTTEKCGREKNPAPELVRGFFCFARFSRQFSRQFSCQFSCLFPHQFSCQVYKHTRWKQNVQVFFGNTKFTPNPLLRARKLSLFQSKHQNKHASAELIATTGGVLRHSVGVLRINENPWRRRGVNIPPAFNYTIV